jgi:hypothetical protein
MLSADCWRLKDSVGNDGFFRWQRELSQRSVRHAGATGAMEWCCTAAECAARIAALSAATPAERRIQFAISALMANTKTDTGNHGMGRYVERKFLAAVLSRPQIIVSRIRSES